MSSTTDTQEHPGAMSRELVVPVVGEVLDLDAPSDRLAEATWRMRELESELARVRKAVAVELVRRMDQENLRSVEVAGYSITVDAPGGLDWDAQGLDQVLAELVDREVITAGARERVVPMKPSVVQRELKKLLATLPEPERELVEGCASPTRRTRRVKVDNENIKTAVRARR